MIGALALGIHAQFSSPCYHSHNDPCPPNLARRFSPTSPLTRSCADFCIVPITPNGNGLVLTHGAGSNCQAPLLVALAETFAAAGYLVLRCDLPFRQDRSFGPPGPGDAKRDRAGLKNAVAALRNLVAGRIFLGGHSYGGRQASMLCAEQSENAPEIAAALLLLSYPLHPPRKPEQLRTQHFFHSAHSSAVRPGHARSLRLDRGN